MSSFTRRIQRTQDHIGLIVTGYDKDGNPNRFKRGLVAGRKRAFMGRGSKLGHTNPKAADLVARKAREERRKNKEN